MLNTFLGGMYSRISNPTSAQPLTAQLQTDYIVADVSGSTMRYSSTEESGIVLPAQSLFRKGKCFMIM